MSTNTHTSSVGSNECYPDIAKLSRKGLPNYERATGHMATASSAAPPRPRVGIDEEDPDSADEEDTDSADEEDTDEEDTDSADEEDTDSADEDDTDSSDEEDTDSADKDDTTLLSGPHSGDKRLSSSCFQRKKDKKKVKMDRVDELIIKVCSIMSKKLELKLAKKQSEYGKEDTTLSGPHSGDKRLSSSYFQRKKDEKKRKMNPVHEAIIKTCSLMTKNLEFKPATKHSKCGKGKETDSFLSDPYGMKVCLDIIQEMDMDMVLRVKALDWLMVSGPELQKTFVKMNPSFRLDWLMKHVG